MTSYDIIWTEFIGNCETEDINLPNTQEKIYDAIHSAVRKFNSRLERAVSYDDLNEIISEDLNDSDLLNLAHMLRWAFLRNQKTFFVTTWQPFQQDIGLKNFKAQVDGLQELINDAEKEIENIIRNSATEFI
jgi:hypothetical protein